MLTGGPGTGKTRTIVAMLAAYVNENPESIVALAAPTGKAAFRMRNLFFKQLNNFNHVPVGQKLLIPPGLPPSEITWIENRIS